jgi:hypothetical protein
MAVMNLAHLLDRLEPPRRDESGRPARGEYASDAADDVALVRGNDVVAALQEQGQALLDMFQNVNEADIAGSRYAPNKWTVKEVLGHMIDDERIFTYRALCIARGDGRPLASFDQNAYQNAARHEERSLQSLLREYAVVRGGSIFLFWPLTAQEWLRRGDVAGYSATVRGLAYDLAGHELRHVRAFRTVYSIPALASYR